MILTLFQPQNILLDYKTIPGVPERVVAGVLTDFGVSALLTDQKMGVKHFKKVDAAGASLMYTPPELLFRYFSRKQAAENDDGEEKEVVIHAVDAFSFSVTFFEALIRAIPWPCSSAKILVEKVVSGKRPTVPSSCPVAITTHPSFKALMEIIESGWMTSPDIRPHLYLTRLSLKKHMPHSKS